MSVSLLCLFWYYSVDLSANSSLFPLYCLVICMRNYNANVCRPFVFLCLNICPCLYVNPCVCSSVTLLACLPLSVCASVCVLFCLPVLPVSESLPLRYLFDSCLPPCPSLSPSVRVSGCSCLCVLWRLESDGNQIIAVCWGGPWSSIGIIGFTTNCLLSPHPHAVYTSYPLPSIIPFHFLLYVLTSKLSSSLRPTNSFSSSHLFLLSCFLVLILIPPCSQSHHLPAFFLFSHLFLLSSCSSPSLSPVCPSLPRFLSTTHFLLFPFL